MSRARLGEATEVFKAAGHPARLRILCMLRSGSLCVCQIKAVLGLAVSTVSEHLAELKRARLLVERKDGRFVSYGLSEDAAVERLLTPLWAGLRNDPEVAADAKLARDLRRIPVEKLCSVDLDVRRLGLRPEALRRKERSA
ncbi:MAG: ArsR/SmtB family transcription factor [Vicinamibacteria bacterium]